MNQQDLELIHNVLELIHNEPPQKGDIPHYTLHSRDNPTVSHLVLHAFVKTIDNYLQYNGHTPYAIIRF